LSNIELLNPKDECKQPCFDTVSIGSQLYTLVSYDSQCIQWQG